MLVTTETLGLRERKKLLTRRAIVDTARALFAERGFDNVTVAEIADRVNISAKTVFVYFASKDDIVFADENEVRDQILDRVRDRPSGQTPLDALAGLLREQLSTPDESPVSDLDRLHLMVGDNPSLRARLRLMWEHFEDALAELLAAETGEGAAPRMAAGQLILVYRMAASLEALEHVRAQPRRKRRAAYVAWLGECVDMAGAGIADYARR